MFIFLLRIIYTIGCLLVFFGICLQIYGAYNRQHVDQNISFRAIMPHRSIKEYYLSAQVDIGEKIMITGAFVCLPVMIICLLGLLSGVNVF